MYFFCFVFISLVKFIVNYKVVDFYWLVVVDEIDKFIYSYV